MAVVEKNGKVTYFELCPLPHASSSRAQVLFCAMVSGFDSTHIRANLPRLEEAIKYGNSAGDR